jgi:hypothetical protein
MYLKEQDSWLDLKVLPFQIYNGSSPGIRQSPLNFNDVGRPYPKAMDVVSGMAATAIVDCCLYNSIMSAALILEPCLVSQAWRPPL